MSMSDMIICIMKSTCSFPSSTVSSRLSQGTSLWLQAGFSRKKEAAEWREGKKERGRYITERGEVIGKNEGRKGRREREREGEREEGEREGGRKRGKERGKERGREGRREEEREEGEREGRRVVTEGGKVN